VPLLGIPSRRRRLEGRAGRFLVLALDHGLPAGPLTGLGDPGRLLRTLRDAPLTGVIVNAGLVPRLAPEIRMGLVVHLSAGTLLGTPPTAKVLASSVERAIRLGADAVSVQIHFGSPSEDRMVADAGRVVDDAHGFGVPVLAMAYPPSLPGRGSADADAARNASRAAAEIGADLVQTNFSGPSGGVRGIVRGCPAPLLLAGGPKVLSADAYLDAVRAGLAEGAAGVTVGRNLFQDPDPPAFAGRLGDAVFGPLPRVGLEASP